MKLLTRMLPFLPLLLCVLVAARGPRFARADEVYPPVCLYQPIPADFRPLYDRDSINKAREAWGGGDGYWAWVQTFYNGYTKRILGLTIIRQPGWTATSRRLVAHVTALPARQELTLELNVLGRDIAGEWAKDDSQERIHASELRRWGDMTRQAGTRDNGSGQVLLAEVRAIQAEVDTHLKGRP